MTERKYAIEVILPVQEGPHDKRDCASPVGYRNVYEDGDEWLKVCGCDGCERVKQCCGNCPHSRGSGCPLHVLGNKPLYCIVNPTPNTCKPHCLLVFECVKGSNVGKFRHLTDRDEPFRGTP